MRYSRFGRVPSLETLTAIRKGEELFSHYKVNNLRYKNDDSNYEYYNCRGSNL